MGLCLQLSCNETILITSLVNLTDTVYRIWDKWDKRKIILCRSLYCLISTKEKLASTPKENDRQLDILIDEVYEKGEIDIPD